MPKVSHRFRYSEQHSSDKRILTAGASNTRRKSHTRDKHPSNSYVKQMSKRTLFHDLRHRQVPPIYFKAPALAGALEVQYRPGEIIIRMTGTAADELFGSMVDLDTCLTPSH